MISEIPDKPSDLENLNLERIGPDFSEGVKLDNNKIQMELLPLRELREVARVLTYGAKKYAPDNWKKVPNAKERYMGALLRHFTEYREGNVFDHETCPDPLRHIAQVACNALFLLYFELQDEITCVKEMPSPSREQVVLPYPKNTGILKE
jgi:hypothetical protein